MTYPRTACQVRLGHQSRCLSLEHELWKGTFRHVADGKVIIVVFYYFGAWYRSAVSPVRSSTLLSVCLPSHMTIPISGSVCSSLAYATSSRCIDSQVFPPDQLTSSFDCSCNEHCKA